MARDLKLQVLLQGIDKVTGPLKKIREGSSKTATALRESKEELDKLKRGQRDISSFRRLKEATRGNSEALAAAQEKLRGMREELKRTSAPSQKFQDDFLKAKTRVEGLTGKLDEQRRELGSVRTRLREAGISVKDLGTAENRMAEQMREANTRIDQQKQKLKEVARQQRLAQQASDRYHRSISRANNMRSAGFTGMATGGAALYAGARMLTPGVDWASQMSTLQAVGRFGADDERYQALRAQSRELGASTAFSATEVGSGQEFLLRAGMSAESIQTSMRDVLDLALANNTELGRTADIASNIGGAFKIDFEQDGAMTRVADILSATASRANVDLEMLGDTMKYLGGAEDLELTMEQAAAMAGMLGNIGIQGSQAGTTLRAMMNRLTNPAAKGAAAIESIGLQVADADDNMRALPDILRDISKATADLGNVERKSILQQIFGAEAGSGTAELVSQMAGGALDDLIDSLGNSYGENAKMARTMTDNIGGDLKGLKSAWEGVGITITDTNNGPLRDLIQSITDITRGIDSWMEENPELAGTLTMVAAVLAAVVAGGGALTIMFASVLGPIAMVRWGMDMLGIKAGGADGKFRKLAKNGLTAVGRAVLWLGRSLAVVGRMLLLNPVGLAITALAGAAYLIYRNWGAISEWFGARWEDIKAAFNEGIGATIKLLLNWNPIGLIYRGITAGLEALGVDIGTDFKSLGGAIIDGIIGGIDMKWSELKDKITGVGSGVKNWFKDTLGINSPSRVFAEYGGNTMDGYQQGLKSGEVGPLKQVSAFSKRLKQTGAGLAIGAASMGIAADVPLDTRPPVSASASAGITINGGINISIPPSPGMDEQALARYVGAEIQRALAEAQRDAGARQRSALYDTD